MELDQEVNTEVRSLQHVWMHRTAKSGMNKHLNTSVEWRDGPAQVLQVMGEMMVQSSDPDFHWLLYVLPALSWRRP